MKKYLITQECDYYISGRIYLGQFKGEVYANSPEEALEKWKNEGVYYELIYDYSINDKGITVEESEEDKECIG